MGFKRKVFYLAQRFKNEALGQVKQLWTDWFFRGEGLTVYIMCV